MGHDPGVNFHYRRDGLIPALRAVEARNTFEEGSLGGHVKPWTFSLDEEEAVIHTQTPYAWTHAPPWEEDWDMTRRWLDIGTYYAGFWVHFTLPPGATVPREYEEYEEGEFQTDVGIHVWDQRVSLHLSSPSGRISTFFLSDPAMRAMWAEFEASTGALVAIEADGAGKWRPFHVSKSHSDWRDRDTLTAYLKGVGVPGVD